MNARPTKALNMIMCLRILLVVSLAGLGTAQSKPLSVCEALNSAADHQELVLRGVSPKGSMAIHVPDRKAAHAKREPRCYASGLAIKGVLIKKPWPLIFRRQDGTYWGNGFGQDGGCPTILVITSTISGL